MNNLEKWMKKCPNLCLNLVQHKDNNNLDFKQYTRFLSSSSHVYEKNAVVVMTLEQLSSLVYKEKIDKINNEMD